MCNLITKKAERPCYEINVDFKVDKTLDEILTHVQSKFSTITYTRTTKDGIISYDASIKTIKQNTNDNVYFLLDSRDNKVLYVGKSKTINTRIRQHLISSSGTTHTKTNNLCDYLEELFNQKLPMAIGYASVRIKPINYYGAAEGYFITRLKDKYITSYPGFEMWNVRED